MQQFSEIAWLHRATTVPGGGFINVVYFNQLEFCISPSSILLQKMDK